MKRLFFVFPFLFFAACMGVDPEAPPLQEFPPALSPEDSRIAIPLSIPIPELQKKINEALKPELYNDDTYGEDKMKLRIERLDEVKLQFNGALLHYDAPVRVTVQRQISNKLGMETPKADFSLHLYFSSTVAVGQDWTLRTKTTLKRYTWLKKPASLEKGKLKILGQDISLEGLLEKKLDEQKEKIGALIDQAIRKNVRLDKILSKIWQNLQKPILLNKKMHKVWIKATPKTLRISPPRGVNNELRLILELMTRAETLTGEEPKYTIQRALPPLQVSSKLEPGLGLNLFADLPFVEVNALLEKKIKNLKIPVEGYKLKIKEAEVYGNGRNIVLKADVRGDVKGTLYFQGRPEYDSASQSLHIRDFGYDVHTEELLLQTADWLLKDVVLEEIQGRLSFPLGEKLNSLPQLIEKGIGKSKAGKKVDLSIDSLKVSAKNIQVYEKGIRLNVHGDGQAKLHLKRL